MARCHSGYLPKDSGQVVLIGESAGQRYLRETKAAIAHERFGAIDSALQNKLVRSLSRALAKAPNQMRWADTGLSS